MRIGIDARDIVGQATGVGRYLSGLLAEWVATGATSRHEIVLYAHAPMPSAPPQVAARVLPGRSGVWWQQVTLPAAANADSLDVFFAPQYNAPLAISAPTVVLIHDVSFAAHPEWFPVLAGLRLRTLTRVAARRAAAVVTVSEFSKREIAEHLGIPAARIDVITQGIPVHGVPGTTVRAPRLLYVGSIFNRRHVPDLIRAFAAVARSHPDATLDIVGDNRTHPFEDVAATIDRAQLGGRITWHAYVSDALLGDLYQHARAFAFLSEYEGLGMTPLEALAAGAPSVLYETEIARESCGDAALYVRRDDFSGLTNAIETLLFGDATRARCLAAAPATLSRYSWPRAAQRMLNVIERCR